VALDNALIIRRRPATTRASVVVLGVGVGTNTDVRRRKSRRGGQKVSGWAGTGFTSPKQHSHLNVCAYSGMHLFSGFDTCGSFAVEGAPKVYMKSTRFRVKVDSTRVCAEIAAVSALLSADWEISIHR
jgi:hypothetical protein